MPLKMTDTRAKKFVQEQGKTAYELDAFEPDDLQGLVRESLEAFTDMDIMEEDLEEEDEDYEYLDELSDDVQEFMRERIGF